MNRKSFGTEDIARICSVTRLTIGDWMKKGKLPFFTAAGGHKRVWEKDLIAFLQAHNIPLTPELERSQVVNILIVEDEAAELKLFTKADLIPCLIILDLFIGDIHGVEICRMIRQDKKLKQIKILAISGKRAKESKQDALDAGADDFLAKPFVMEELEEKLKKLLPKVGCIEV